MEQTHGPSVTMLRVPLVGNLRYAKSGSTGSHISVDVGGRYSPTESAGLLVICSDFLDLHSRLSMLVFFFSFSNITSYPDTSTHHSITQRGPISCVPFIPSQLIRGAPKGVPLMSFVRHDGMRTIIVDRRRC